MKRLKQGRQAKELGQLDRALVHFESAAQIDPKNAFAWANLGSTYVEEGKLDESIQAFEKACQHDPKHQGFKAQLNKLIAMKKRGHKLPRVEDVQVKKMCSGCHAFPDPQALPRDSWAMVLATMHELQGGFADIDPRAVLQWFRLRSPKQLARPNRKAGIAMKKLHAKKRSLAPKPARGGPAVAAVAFMDVIGDSYPELFASDMRNGKMLMALPYAGDDTLYVIAHIPNPAHFAAVDLDRDGRKDLLVANLGSIAPEVHTRGSIFWLRQTKKRGFETKEIYKGLGRVSDVQAADFDGDGDLDLLVAEYGSRLTGRVLLLEQISMHRNKPKFKLHTLDSRAGAINVPIADFNQDGRPDFAVVFAEHHETISIFVNEGGLEFQEVSVFRAPHPVWGFTGMTLADLDQDGDPDIIATNGDGFDAGDETGGLFHDFHGVQIFENQGSLQFKTHESLKFRGVHSVTVGDLDGDGDIDLAASAFQPFLSQEGRHALQLDSVVWFEQTAKFTYARHAVEAFETEHASLAAGDFDLDGDTDLAVGRFTMPSIDPKNPDRGAIWNNQAAPERGEWVKLFVNHSANPGPSK